MINLHTASLSLQTGLGLCLGPWEVPPFLLAVSLEPRKCQHGRPYLPRLMNLKGVWAFTCRLDESQKGHIPIFLVYFPLRYCFICGHVSFSSLEYWRDRGNTKEKNQKTFFFCLHGGKWYLRCMILPSLWGICKGMTSELRSPTWPLKLKVRGYKRLTSQPIRTSAFPLPHS